MREATRFMRTEGAAAYCCLSPRTLEKLRGLGQGPRFIRPEGHRFVRYRQLDLDAWLESGLREPGQDQGGA